ncbi:MAG: hypothetical protein KBT45_06995, partial [Bacteroidales bacterium]|nr:hypothetical protein [Candidatus Colimorpha pelethequi]
GPALGNLRMEILTFKTLRSAHCLSEASLHALVLKVEILANFLQPVYFLFASFLFCTSKREMKNPIGVSASIPPQCFFNIKSGIKKSR